MDFILTLMKLEDKIYKLKMRSTKKTYLTIEEIQEKMRNREGIPTSIFNTDKIDYIVKARTIYGPKSKRKIKIK